MPMFSPKLVINISKKFAKAAQINDDATEITLGSYHATKWSGPDNSNFEVFLSKKSPSNFETDIWQIVSEDQNTVQQTRRSLDGVVSYMAELEALDEISRQSSAKLAHEDVLGDAPEAFIP